MKLPLKIGFLFLAAIMVNATVPLPVAITGYAGDASTVGGFTTTAVTAGGTAPVNPPTTIDGKCTLCFYTSGGHGFIKIKTPDKKWRGYGFYPDFEQLNVISMFYVTGQMNNDINYPWEKKVCYKVSEQKCKTVFQVVEKWKTQKYSVFASNCVSFIRDVAKQIRLNIPSTGRCVDRPEAFADNIDDSGKGITNTNKDKHYDSDPETGKQMPEQRLASCINKAQNSLEKRVMECKSKKRTCKDLKRVEEYRQYPTVEDPRLTNDRIEASKKCSVPECDALRQKDPQQQKCVDEYEKNFATPTTKPKPVCAPGMNLNKGNCAAPTVTPKQNCYDKKIECMKKFEKANPVPIDYCNQLNLALGYDNAGNSKTPGWGEYKECRAYLNYRKDFPQLSSKCSFVDGLTKECDQYSMKRDAYDLKYRSAAKECESARVECMK